MREIKYIPFLEFVDYSNVGEATIKRRYRDIPGLTKVGKEFKVLSGTRYPFDKRYLRIKDSAGKHYTLLNAISHYRYISHRELKLEHPQFQRMLGDLLAAGLIRENGLSNEFGANAYDCTPKGDAYIKCEGRKAIADLCDLIAKTAGTFLGSIASQVIDVA